MRDDERVNGPNPLREYLSILWGRKWLVLIVTVGVFGFSMWYTLRLERLYEAVTTIQVISGNSPVIQSALGGLLESSRSVDTEIEILKSRVIGEKTVVRLERHYALSPLPPGVSVELSGVKVTDKTEPGTYTVTFMDDAGGYRVRDPGGNVIGEGKPGQAFEGRDLSFTLSRVSVKAGSTVQIRVYSLADLGDALRSGLKVALFRGTNILSLRVGGNDPKEATRVVNAFAEAYVDFTREQKILQLVNMREFLERQIAAFREDLLKTAQIIGQSSIEARESVLTDVSGANAKGELAKRLVDMELQRIGLQSIYTPNHRLMVQLEREISMVRDQLTSQLRPEKRDMPLRDLLRESDLKLGMYNYMYQKVQEARIAEASESGSARVIDRAIPPKGPVSPNVSRNLRLGAVLGLSLGIGLALLLSHWDQSLKNVKDVEVRAGLPVFGVVPVMVGGRDGWYSSLLQREEGRGEPKKLLLAYDGTGKASVIEAYRSLKTNIRFAVPQASRRIFLFTSAGPGEGKSLTVANLAIAACQGGRRVLLVDGDLRKPTQHRLFGLEADVGLTEVLAGNVTWREAVRPTSHLNLDLLPCGSIPPDPTELLAGNRLEELLREAQREYELILLDSSPVLGYSDASIVAPMASGVFVVVRSGQTTPEAVARLRSCLGAMDAKLIGAILNRFSGAGAGYYYNYDGYYDNEDNQDSGHLERLTRGMRRLIQHAVSKV